MTKTRMLLLILAAGVFIEASATTILIQNNDAVGEGFNDQTDANTIAIQKGNNPGTTLGAMRLNLFVEAARVWGEILKSQVVITVGANFDPMPCEEGGTVLGSGSATSSHADFRGSEPGVAYSVALAESINRANLNGGSVEVTLMFNSTVDADDNCLGDGGFYYGLDENIPPGTIPLFPVVLHELAHGLGFSSLSDVGPDGSGKFVGAGGYPDSYSRNLLDLDSGKSWDEMDDTERKASALNEPSLVWQGPKTTLDRSVYLLPMPVLIINEPESIAGEFEAIPGEEPLAVIPPGGLTRSIVDGNVYGDLDADPGPADGCSQLNFNAPFGNKIVLFDASELCGTFEQARWSQVEAAVGVVIAATAENGIPDMSGKYISGGASIPYVGVERSVGVALRSNLDTANVTIGFSSTQFMGDNQGKLKMFAPSQYREEVSVSHWSRTARPGLLMQPSLGHLEHAAVDLTAAAFRDIGWSVNIPGEPSVMIFEDSFDE